MHAGNGVQVSQVASVITPVPGGVGPMTVAAMIHNLVCAAKLNNGLPLENLAPHDAHTAQLYFSTHPLVDHRNHIAVPALSVFILARCMYCTNYAMQIQTLCKPFRQTQLPGTKLMLPSADPYGKWYKCSNHQHPVNLIYCMATHDCRLTFGIAEPALTLSH